MDIDLVSCEIDGRAVVIKIPIPYIKHIAETMNEDPTFGTQLKVLDPERFAADILSEFKREEEDGSTSVHRMLESAITSAIEWGSEAIELFDPPEGA